MEGQRALADIARQLSFGPRALDTPGHEKTIDYIESEMAQARHRDPAPALELDQRRRRTHGLTNIVARLYPDNPRRIILGTHYDSIVRAYARQEASRRAVMPGANNSASGVALLLETARVLHAAKSPPPVGVDFVFFDGEEGPISLGAGDPHWQPLGSPYFAAASERFLSGAKPAAGGDLRHGVLPRAEACGPRPSSLLYAARRGREILDHRPHLRARLLRAPSRRPRRFSTIRSRSTKRTFRASW